MAQRFSNSRSVFEKRFREETPEFFSLSIQNSQFQQYPRQRCDSPKHTIVIGFAELLRGALHRNEHALVIFTRAVDRSHDCLITLNQECGIQPRLEVQLAFSIVTTSLAQETSFSLEPFPKLSIRKRVEQSNHGDGNGAFANEIDLPIQDVDRIVVEANNKASHNFHSVALNLLHGTQQVAAVL